MESTVGIALLGCGTVGGGVAGLLSQRRAHIERRSGARYELLGIANRSHDPLSLVDDPRTDVVIECIGGTDIALECIERALESRKHVVTANKDAIATQGPRLRALAQAKGVTLRYEASVASAVPIVTTLDHALAGDEIVEIGGVLNGTCNFILSKMREGRTFAESLLAAQVAGYAEADPRNDIEGTDAAHKLAILIQHAFGQPVISPRIPRRGILGVTSATVRRARQHGYELKLVAFAKRSAEGINAEVGPVLVPFAHPFAQCGGVDNVVRVVGASSGPLFFSGAGAGRDAAAAAVLGDVIATLRALAERHNARPARPAAFATQPVAGAFEHFPAFAGYPVLTGHSHHAPATQELLAHSSPGNGEEHVDHAHRTIAAV
ncbi:MAG TPA: homoserine dehydrogenase [Candidatus Baltobacteraceae bacterium]|jgi:homoserine dehydrogenase|nr:homoserine dehydrogenase [Candidatus Baltobacteraceae bacterium]